MLLSRGIDLGLLGRHSSLSHQAASVADRSGVCGPAPWTVVQLSPPSHRQCGTGSGGIRPCRLLLRLGRNRLHPPGRRFTSNAVGPLPCAGPAHTTALSSYYRRGDAALCYIRRPAGAAGRRWLLPPRNRIVLSSSSSVTSLSTPSYSIFVQDAISLTPLCLPFSSAMSQGCSARSVVAPSGKIIS